MDFGFFRNREFPLLDQAAAPVTYLDWTGAALPPASLIERHCSYLTTKLLGNPHSSHPPSKNSMDDSDRTRAAVLAYFKADPREYDVIFTSGATGAILLLQHFMFEGGELLLSADNHNSVNGLREVAKRAGAKVRYVPLREELGIDWSAGEEALKYPLSRGRKLFCYPAKSNYSGVHQNLGWVADAQRLGWHVLLDAAAYLANERLDLSSASPCHPDFVPVSFYKLFGFPTGLGCLIIKKTAYATLNKKWFAGGSILLVAVAKDFYAHEVEGHAMYEDGTQNFASMAAVRAGFDFLDRLDMTGFDRFAYAIKLADELIAGIQEMRTAGYSRQMRMGYGNDIIIHSPGQTDIVTFSVVRNGSYIDAWEVEQAAAEHKICFRTGCFCNPGVNEKVFGYNVSDFEHLQATSRAGSDLTLERFKEVSGGKSIGAIRASFGYANNPEDVKRALVFLHTQVAGR